MALAGKGFLCVSVAEVKAMRILKDIVVKY